jgi:hypothetical protein
MKNLKMSGVLLSLVLLVSCSSVVIQDKVISRSDELSSRPAWVKESNTLTVEKDVVYIMGQAKIPAENANISQGYRVAENNAKVSLAGSIEQRLNYAFQNAEEGLDVNQNQIKYVSAEAAKISVSNLKPSNRYWEKVLSVVDGSGKTEMFYTLFARMQIKESDLKKAIDNTMNKNKGISDEFKKQVDQQWDKIINAE